MKIKSSSIRDRGIVIHTCVYRIYLTQVGKLSIEHEMVRFPSLNSFFERPSINRLEFESDGCITRILVFTRFQNANGAKELEDVIESSPKVLYAPSVCYLLLFALV